MSNEQYWDRYFGVGLEQVDPDVDLITGFEEERQARKLIMIPSESMAPQAVRSALGSVFNNVYAEGYPPLRMTRDEEPMLLDIAHQLAYYRRYADRRFYKGVDYVHFVETLAQRRAAACFANDRVGASDIYVNVQPLSGAAANLAVYDAMVDVGDVVMGMDLYQGGHLTHGSEFNFSGKRYHVISYGVNRQTGKLDYDEIRDLAREHKPKLIIAGYTSYTWAPDWQVFAEIAHEVGAVLLADISHPAGMVIAGAFPNPVGIADVITFTTHKTLCGPRGAVIMCTDEELANTLDMAVFPGEQGGPHTQKFAAMAVAFKIARTEPFARLQWQIKENAVALAEGLRKRGAKLAYGGTDTHFCMLDLNGVETDTGFPLRGEPAVRILDLVGIVANKNTIPGDEETAKAMGIRLGTPWLTQRGFGPAEMDEVAGLIHKTVTHIHPFSYIGLAGELPRGKIALDVMEEIKYGVANLAAKGVAETEDRGSGYPHYYNLAEAAPDLYPGLHQAPCPGPEAESQAIDQGAVLFDLTDHGLLQLTGDRAEPCLQQLLTSDVAALQVGQCQCGFLLDQDAMLIDDVTILRLAPDAIGRDRYLLHTNPQNHERVKAWLRATGDGYTLFDREDIFRKVEGPIIVEDLRQAESPECLVMLGLLGPQVSQILASAGDVPGYRFAHSDQEVGLAVLAGQVQMVYDRLVAAGATPASPETSKALRAKACLPDYYQLASYGPESGRPAGIDLCSDGHEDRFSLAVPYFVGCRNLDPIRPAAALPQFQWVDPQDPPLQRTPLYDWHKAHTRKIIPFAGWEMPVWYTGVLDEHKAVRRAAGLFDVAHMGVFEISGPNATEFLDLVCTNYVRWFEPGESFYSYFLDPQGHVIDDLMVYRRGKDLYLMVVNAACADKDWAWLNAVNNGEVLIDPERPDLRVLRPATLRNLKDPANGADMRVDLALQGPASLAILQSLTGDVRLKDRLARVPKTGVIECELDSPTSQEEKFDLIIARTGYTGEDTGYELFVHPEEAVAFWEALMQAGAAFGLQPCGLACRDSTRTEAGLPLYGHELAGPFDISPTGAGFGSYVKLHKPYFVGRTAHLVQERARTMEIARFRMNERGVRMPKTGDPVVNRRGRVIGWVTSAAVDVDGVILGLAYIETRYHRAGDQIDIFNLPARPVREKGDKAELEPGDKVQLPDAATVLMRFPDDDERSRWRGTPVVSMPRFLPAGE
jgi:glycine cleavage system T protein